MISLLLWLSTHSINPTFPVENFHSAAVFRSIPRTPLKTQSVRPFPVAKEANVPWNGHFSAQNFQSTGPDRTKLDRIKENLKASIVALPTWHTSAMDSLEVRKKTSPSRGLGNSEKIILNTDSISNNGELVAVFIHEMGHITDLGALKGNQGGKTEFFDDKKPIVSDDPSVQFYRISWSTANTRKSETGRNDFVSGYAMTNCFEDFAESYLFYRLHGEKFRFIAEKSPELAQKYEFLKTKVFDGQEFQIGNPVGNFIHNTIWDATLLPVDPLTDLSQK